MKTLVIINESFEKMILGKNTTLAYILAAFELGHQVYIVHLPENGEGFVRDVNRSILAMTLGKKEGKLLSKHFKAINKRMVGYVQKKEYAQLNAMPSIEVRDHVSNIETQMVLLKEIGLVLQRSEPMKAPFPPKGDKKVDDILAKIRKIFPNKILFNCPIGLEDKEFPQETNRILDERNEQLIAIPTAEFTLRDKSVSKAFDAMKEEYGKMYGGRRRKLVIKPKNSAQTLGVFAVEYSAHGLDLAAIKSQKVATLMDHQRYEIKEDLDEKELKKVIEILCFVQSIKSDKASYSDVEKNKISDFKPVQIIEIARGLYNEKILVQPFLEGVKSGDIRLNYLKNSDGNFYLAGRVFRSSLRQEDSDDFTTAYITGGATSKPLSSLFAAEEKDVMEKSEVILGILNGPLREKYQNATELGADFILVGDNKTALLGEVNHHCQGLIPVSEAMEKADDLHAPYDGGLALVKKAIEDNVKLQQGRKGK